MVNQHHEINYKDLNIFQRDEGYKIGGIWLTSYVPGPLLLILKRLQGIFYTETKE